MAHKVVAHFIDHDIIKGTSLDVDPGRPRCHIQTTDRGTVEVDLTQVKALYFVKDLGGRPEYRESGEVVVGDQRVVGSRQVRIRFQDGEEQGGLINRFPPTRPFFFVLPVDPQSNNERILVNRNAVSELRPIEEQRESQTTTRPSLGLTTEFRRPRRTTWVFDGTGIKEIDLD